MSWSEKSASGKPVSDLRRNLEHRCRDCKWCQGQGFYTIFDRRYDGLPYVEKKTPDGRLRRFKRIDTIPCVCPLGSWIRGTREDQATAIREINLQDVIEGQRHVRNWSLTDPRLPYCDPGEVAEPGVFRAMIEAGSSVRRIVDIEREHKKTNSERWYIQFLVHFLRTEPAPFSQLLEMASLTGHNDVAELRRAGAIVGIQRENRHSGEHWILPKE